MKTKKIKIQEEQEKKQELAEYTEHLRQIDLPEGQGGGEKYAIDKLKSEEKEGKKEEDKVKSYLESERNRRFSYRRNLARHGNSLLEEIGFPSLWEYAFIPTDGTDINVYGKRFETKEGIVLIVHAPDGKTFVRAISTTMNAEYDVAAVKTLAVQAENTLDAIKGLLIEKDGGDKTPSGIYLPHVQRPK